MLLPLLLPPACNQQGAGVRHLLLFCPSAHAKPASWAPLVPHSTLAAGKLKVLLGVEDSKMRDGDW